MRPASTLAPVPFRYRLRRHFQQKRQHHGGATLRLINGISDQRQQDRTVEAGMPRPSICGCACGFCLRIRTWSLQTWPASPKSIQSRHPGDREPSRRNFAPSRRRACLAHGAGLKAHRSSHSVPLCLCRHRCLSNVPQIVRATRCFRALHSERFMPMSSGVSMKLFRLFLFAAILMQWRMRGTPGPAPRPAPDPDPTLATSTPPGIRSPARYRLPFPRRHESSARPRPLSACGTPGASGIQPSANARRSASLPRAHGKTRRRAP